jgi:hypothetical protein
MQRWSLGISSRISRLTGCRAACCQSGRSLWAGALQRRKVGLRQRAFGARARLLISLNGLQSSLVAVGGVAQKDQASTGMDYSEAVRLELARS